MPFLGWREVQSPTQGGQGALVDGGRAAHVRGGQGAQVQGGQGTQVQRRQGAQRQGGDYNNVYGPKDYLDDIRSAIAVYRDYESTSLNFPKEIRFSVLDFFTSSPSSSQFD